MPTISPPKKLPQAKTQFTVEFTAEESKAAEDKAVEQMSQQVNIQGFRPGKAPTELVRPRLKNEAVLDETIRTLLPDSIANLGKEHDLKPIMAPMIEVESVSPIKVKLTFIEKPTAMIKNIDKIKVEKKEPKVDEKDVQRMVDYLLDQHKVLTETDRAAIEGDQVTMDFVGVDEHKNEIPGTRSSGYQAVIGSKTLIPGFEEELKGLVKDQEKSFSITFPEKYHAEHLRGKPATFSVKVTKIEEVQKPQLTDELAKEKFQAESAADFRSKITDSMRQQEEGVAQQKREEEMFDALAKATTVDLADELIEQEARAILLDLRDRLQQQGASIEDWLKQTQRDAESLQKEMRDQAKRRLTLRFGLEKALEEKKIEVTDDDVQQLIATLPEHDRTHVKGPGTEEFEQLRWRKKVEKFVEMMLV